MNASEKNHIFEFLIFTPFIDILFSEHWALKYFVIFERKHNVLLIMVIFEKILNVFITNITQIRTYNSDNKPITHFIESSQMLLNPHNFGS